MTVETFLEKAGWARAARAPLAGDASTRRYTRLQRGSERAILMEDPDGAPEHFARLAHYLLGLGLSAPEPFAEAPGLLLLEDLGDGVFAKLARERPEQEDTLYLAAVEALVTLHAADPPDVPPADPRYFTDQASDALEWYLRGLGAETSKTDPVIAELGEALAKHAPQTDVTILRDFHAENLIWLPDRQGPARAGLLDFQDALQGHRAYDMVSLIEDARRDVSETTRQAVVRFYLDATGETAAEFETAMAVQGAARNLRILGIFARLAANRGKPGYIDLVPRVWGHLSRDLTHPALADLAAAIEIVLPRPTEAHLQSLRSQCQTPS
ncbi:Phosphotransferase enzyme family protein [Roseivivax sp. THAF30]|nr:phosphotransferase [Roseivivax sp. THAF30]QFT64864.1 Phosphotransferase enzyme family protein [Roseivivax sp. THAF30]